MATKAAATHEDYGNAGGTAHSRGTEMPLTTASTALLGTPQVERAIAAKAAEITSPLFRAESQQQHRPS